jgi:hypothetical protein
MISLGELLIVMPTIPQSIQTFFNDHQARLAAVSAAPGVVGLSLDLDQISATYLSKEIQILVRPKYSAHCNAGNSGGQNFKTGFLCFALSETSEAACSK